MRRLRYAWAMAAFALCGMMATAGLAGVSITGDTKDDGSIFYAGYAGGGGYLRIDGGVFDRSVGYLGYNSGSMGMATISGAGSKWNNSSYIDVGFYGTGTLQVEAGGQVSSNGGGLGYWPGSTGVVTITGAGSTWTNSGDLWVGRDGSGTLTVSDGGVVSAKALYASLSNLYGNGMITVQGGGVLDADLSLDTTHGLTNMLRFGSGGTLQFTVDGSRDLGAGYEHAGSLRIAEGRSITSINGYLGYKAGSTGTATITGVGTTWASRGLYIGYYGNGTLRVEAGAQVSSTYGELGRGTASSTGTVIITGAGSTWANSESLLVGGYYGTGTLTVSDGGMVSTKTINASLSDLYGNGTITVQSGGIVDADLSFDAAHGLTSTLPFGSGGTLQFTIDGTRILGVGFRRSGSLRISGGGSVASTFGYLGYDAGSTGAATITGAGSTWTNSSNLDVGWHGNGTLRVEAGGQVSNDSGYLGSWPGSTGEAIITGAGSKWSNSGSLYVGHSGSGTLRIEAGGQVSNINGYLGSNPGGTGAAVVTGAGSMWTNSGWLWVGNSGTGALTVSDGGQVTARNLSLYIESTVRLHVSGNRMLVLGDASTVGSVSNYGTVSFLADAFLPAGTYRPIGEYADRNMSWSGSGSTLAVGGVWDGSAGTFTVGESVRVDAGTAAEVAGGMRMVVRDVESGERAGVSFGALTSGTTLTSLPLTESERAGLLPLLGSQEMVLSGWDFVGELAGGEALVSFEVGVGAEGVRVWRRGQEGWQAYAPEMLTYDSKGIVSFTVDPAALNGSGYAVSGVVPEPAALGMLMVAAGMGLVRRRRMAVAAK